MSAKPVLVIKDGCVVTGDAKDTRFDRGDIVIRGNCIAAVGPNAGAVFVDAETIDATTPEGTPIAVPIGEELEEAIDAYAETRYWGDDAPLTIEGRYDPDLVASLYDDQGEVIWPG